MNTGELKAQINMVVVTRRLAEGASANRAEAYQSWLELHQHLFDHENDAKTACQEAEDQLREMTIQAYAETGNKAPEIGVGIRVRTILDYEPQDAMMWAVEHKLALKLDTSAFEKIAKTNNLPFVTISEEAQATIATDLQELS